MELIYGIAGKLFHSVKPFRDELYKRFVKTFPCCACGVWWNIDPCHTGPHSHGAKGCDLRCIPLCRRCHNAFDRNPIQFAAAHNMDVAGLIQTYRELYSITFPERKQPGMEGAAEAVRREA
jgi:hypothetical protein